jgi:ABC-type uncharacterized transport system permease subunit
MPQTSAIFFSVAALLYAIGAVISCWVLASRKRDAARSIPWLVIIGLGSHLVALVTRLFEEGQPDLSLRELVLLLAFAGISAYLVAHFKFRLEVMGIIILPLIVALMGVTVFLPNEPERVSPGWQLSLRAVHVVPAVIGVAFLFLTFATSVIYLIQERGLKSHRPLKLFSMLPSLERCDRIAYLSLGWGFAFLTIVVVTGALTNRYTQGGLSWIPREKWSLLAWALFAVVIYDRAFAGRWRGRLSSILSIIGFIAIIMRMVGIGS